MTTGRNKTDPALQNMPMRTEEGRKIRDAFTPKMPVLDIDYAALEARLHDGKHVNREDWEKFSSHQLNVAVVVLVFGWTRPTPIRVGAQWVTRAGEKEHVPPYFTRDYASLARLMAKVREAGDTGKKLFLSALSDLGVYRSMEGEWLEPDEYGMVTASLKDRVIAALTVFGHTPEAVSEVLVKYNIGR